MISESSATSFGAPFSPAFGTRVGFRYMEEPFTQPPEWDVSVFEFFPPPTEWRS